MSQSTCYYLPQPPRAWSRVQNACSLINGEIYENKDAEKIAMLNSY